MKGYVYFIQINGLQPIKIGYTTDPKGTDRFDSAKTYGPFGVTYVAHIVSSNAAKLERELHKRFADKRLNGEWFDITQADAYKVAMQNGGNAGLPTLNVQIFNQMQSEKLYLPELPLRVAQWYEALPNIFNMDYLLNNKIQTDNNKKANVIKQSTIYKWVKKLRHLKLIELDTTGMLKKTGCEYFADNKLPLNIQEWHEALPNNFKRKELLSERGKELNAKFQINGFRTMDKYLSKLKELNLLYADNSGNYTKTKLK
jgi:hypothetical protein